MSRPLNEPTRLDSVFSATTTISANSNFRDLDTRRWLVVNLWLTSFDIPLWLDLTLQQHYRGLTRLATEFLRLCNWYFRYRLK